VGKVSTIITTTQATTYNIGNVVGSNVYFAGGGGGGGASAAGAAGGAGGGGAGAAGGSIPGTNGISGTGGGGGGVSYPAGSASGGNGGKGVAIIRYADTYTAASNTTGSPNVIIEGGYRIYIWTSSGTITF